MTVTVAMRASNSRKIAMVTPIVRAISVRLDKLGVKEAIAIAVGVGVVTVVVVIVVVVVFVVVVVVVDSESVNELLPAQVSMVVLTGGITREDSII